MYARMTLVDIDIVRTDMQSALGLYKDGVLPALRDQAGYAGVIVMATPEGRGAVVSLWDTAQAAEANADDGFYSDALAQFLTIFKSPPDRERYEVVFAELPAATTV
jgi:hypothetical protein